MIVDTYVACRADASIESRTSLRLKNRRLAERINETPRYGTALTGLRSCRQRPPARVLHRKIRATSVSWLPFILIPRLPKIFSSEVNFSGVIAVSSGLQWRGRSGLSGFPTRGALSYAKHNRPLHKERQSAFLCIKKLVTSSLR